MGTTGYNVMVSRNGYSYLFTSVGPKGAIEKIVTLQPMGVIRRFNLAMGDVSNGGIDYNNITNNNDLEKVFATVATIARIFLKRFPDREVFVAGNTPARNRLYRSHVSKNLEAIEEEFYIYGQDPNTGEFSKFEKSENYVSILLAIK